MKPFQPWFPGRLIAVDHGSCFIKLLLLEVERTGIRVLAGKVVDLQEEGLVTPEESRRHLAGLLQEWGGGPLALALPAHLSFAQVLDLPAGGEKDIPQVIEAQTGRLRGISNSPLVYDAVALTPFAKFQKPYFVTIAREDDVDQHIKRVTETPNEVRDVASLASALVFAHQALRPEVPHCVLVDIGASSTVVVVVSAGQPVFASSFAVGSRAFAEAVAIALKLPVPEAEAQLAAQDLFAGAKKVPALVNAVGNWQGELRKTLEGCRKQNSDGLPTGQPVSVIVSGGAVRLPGFWDYLRNGSEQTYSLWPALTHGGEDLRAADFAVAYGAAVAAVRRPLDTPSLLPPALRLHGRNLRKLAGANMACLVSLVVVAVLLAGATWLKASLLIRKRNLARSAEAALAQVRQIETQARQRDQAFERYWPLLDRQERTLDLLHTLHMLQQSRSRYDFFCVLLADSDSYSRGTTLPPVITNRLSITNTLPLGDESLAKPAFTFELCVPAQGDRTLKTVSDVVTDLRKDPLFSRVDSVPASQRRALVDAKVLIPDRHFAVTVDLADLGWRGLFQTVKVADPLVGGTNAVRRLPAWLPLRSRGIPAPAVNQPTPRPGP